MKYINTETLEVLNLTSVMSLENTSIPRGQAFETWKPVKPSTPPEVDALHITKQGSPVEVEGEWFEGWEIVEKSPSEVEAEYMLYLEDYYDSVAQSKRYDNRFSFAIRAGYPSPFQQEAQTFASWMDNCNHQAYQILQAVLQGLRDIPSKEELLQELPQIVW